MKLKWSKTARDQLKDLVSYISKDNPRAARAVAGRIRQALSVLEEHPRIGRVIPEFGDPDIRERIVPPYRLLYQVQKDAILFLGIYHSQQTLPDTI